MPNYAVNGDQLTAIGNAIRDKLGTTDKYKINDMPDAIESIQTGGNPEPLIVHDNGTWESANGFSPVTAEIYAQPLQDTLHLVNGKWICPDDWDDVEQIPLPDDPDAQVLYVVHRTDVPLPFISYSIISGAYKYRLGHAVGNEFVPTTDWANKSSGQYVQMMIQDDYEVSGKHTIVLQIEPQSYTTKLTGTRAGNWTDQNINSADYVPIVIRYGKLPYATSLNGVGYMCECENIRDCVSITSLSGYMSYNKRLQKWRHDGWVMWNCTNYANMLNGCRYLEDIDTDFRGFVTNKATNISAMFSNCHRIHNLDVRGWDTTNVTTIGSIFSLCYNLTDIVGIEEWYLPKCTGLGGSTGPFAECYSLVQTHSDGILDLSNWRVGEQITANISMQNMFNRLPRIKEIRINGWNLSRCTSASTMCGNCFMCEKIDMRGITPPSSGLLTTIGSMFMADYSLKEILCDGDGILTGWDIKNVVTMSNMFERCTALKRIALGTPAVINTVPQTSNVYNTFTNSVATEYLDMSAFDAGTISTSFGTVASDARWLTTFYPPKNLKFNWNISYHPYLGRDSLLATIEALAPVTVARTLTLGTYNRSKLTDAEIAVAVQKGWTIA